MDNILLPNIIEIIENDNIENEYIVLSELEDTIINLYEKNTNSNMFTNDFLLLKKIDNELSQKINMQLYDLNLEDVLNMNKKIRDNSNNIVITGPYVRSILVNNKNNVKKEIYVNCIKELKYTDIIDESFNQVNEFYFKNYNDFTIYVSKKTFKNQSEVILSNYNLKRIGYYCGEIYVSYIFIADFVKLNDSINSDIVDPVYGTKLDLFDIYEYNLNNNLNVFDVINKKNYEEYKSKFNFNKYDVIDFDKNSKSYSLTPCEYAINLYVNEHNDIIKSQLKSIILDLSSKKYMRDPCFYADMIELQEHDSELFDILKNNKNYKNIVNTCNQKIRSINDINNLFLSYYINTDNEINFYEYLKYRDDKNIKIEMSIFNLIIEKNPKKIIIYGIKNNIFSERSKYKIALWTQYVDYFNLLGEDFDIEIATNYINDIVENNLIKSFYFLYKIDKTITNIVDSENNNLLHNIKENGRFDEMIDLILKLDDSLLFKKNNNGENPLIKHCKNNNLQIVSLLINNIIHNGNEILFESTDNDKNTVLHHLCRNDNTLQIIKKIITAKPDIVNCQNKLYETPIIISAKSSQEDVLYYLKGISADLTTTDIYGNTLYHYICLNELCIGIDIINKENIFGYKPSHYSKISYNYYYYIN